MHWQARTSCSEAGRFPPMDVKPGHLTQVFDDPT